MGEAGTETDQASGGATITDETSQVDQATKEVTAKQEEQSPDATHVCSEGTQTTVASCSVPSVDPEQVLCVICQSHLDRLQRRQEKYYPPPPEQATEETPTKGPPEGPFIRYQNFFTNLHDERDVVYQESAYEPIVDENKTNERQPVFEIVHTFRSAQNHNSFNGMLYAPPHVRGSATKSINIFSPHVMDAIRSVVTYYPEVDLTGANLTLIKPYRLLVHHYDELREYQKRSKDTAEVSEAGSDDAYSHLNLLLDFVDTEVMADVAKERSRHKRGLVTFDNLWLLLKPGSDVAFINYGPKSKGATAERTGAVLAAVTGGPSKGRRETWNVDCFSLNYNGEYLSREIFTEYIAPFDGEIELNRVAVLPVDMAKPPDKESTRQYLIEQGKRYYSMLKTQSMQHSGQVLDFPFHQVEGQVMVDLPSHIEQNLKGAWAVGATTKPLPSPGPLPPPPGMATAQTFVSDESILSPNTFSDYDNLRPEAIAKLSDHQYFLCPQKVPVYLFKARAWIKVDVRNMTAAEYRPKLMETLVLDEKRRRLLTALAKGFMREETTGSEPAEQHWTADFVKGKGNSQIILLHGQPGVGKTYTAECIAELTRRPLMTLTTSDIGTDPRDVEKNLEYNFKLAKRWGAILLIDEADIYLERRSQTDLARNSLVAGFLRALEIYEGMLILTTNRVGAFDDAFISRIHVKLYYPSLTKDDRQKLWNNFMEKLRDERGEHMRIMPDAEDFIESPKIQDLQLNGREIRNIFQTAVGLADYEEDKDPKGRIKLKRDHIAQVAEMSGEFKDYLSNLLAGDENQRAEKSFLRINDTLETI